MFKRDWVTPIFQRKKRNFNCSVLVRLPSHSRRQNLQIQPVNLTLQIQPFNIDVYVKLQMPLNSCDNDFLICADNSINRSSEQPSTTLDAFCSCSLITSWWCKNYAPSHPPSKEKLGLLIMLQLFYYNCPIYNCPWIMLINHFLEKMIISCVSWPIQCCKNQTKIRNLTVFIQTMIFGNRSLRETKGYCQQYKSYNIFFNILRILKYSMFY